MIYLFAGTDTSTKIKALDIFISDLRDTEVYKISRSNFDPMQVESFYSGDDLFAKKSALIFLSLLEREEEREVILENLDKMNESHNFFVFVEGKLNKPIIDSFKKARAELNLFEETKIYKEKFNNFILANALGERNKLKLWTAFRQALSHGAELDALAGLLFWKIKDMLLKRHFTKFTESELHNLASKVSILLPEARARRQDDEAVFEKFLLEAF